MANRPMANTCAARPTVREVLRSALLRAVLPALVMFGLLFGIGKALMTVPRGAVRRAHLAEGGRRA